jgi:hypothetical protein
VQEEKYFQSQQRGIFFEGATPAGASLCLADLDAVTHDENVLVSLKL